MDGRTPAVYCELKPQTISADTCNENVRKPTLCMYWIPDHLFIFQFLFIYFFWTCWFKHIYLKTYATISCSSLRYSTTIPHNFQSDSPLHIFNALCKDKKKWMLTFYWEFEPSVKDLKITSICSSLLWSPADLNRNRLYPIAL